MESTAAVAALTALAHASRLALFRLLVQAGPDGLAAGDIAETLDIPKATLSFHLKILTLAGLITIRHQSRFIFYAADFATMNELLAFMTENCCAGVPCEVGSRTCTPNTSPPHALTSKARPRSLIAKKRKIQ
jgi:ArsR family transcriptional regulator, arsenate/arsenite/antimonite-responsive transcriptional repressor